jgi:hypothetical protein
MKMADMYVICSDLEGVFVPNLFAKVDPKTVGQFTGLKDINDVDIYSGDMSGDKTLDKYLKAIEVKKDEIDIFKPFLRQLGVGLKDIEVAIERYNENMKNSEG